ncbi:MAG: hypothetical protein RLZZ15_2134 [Verrucomicrobiota bacterium]|jgi:hypothetical protein
MSPQKLPWYDAIWLRQYLLAKEILGRVRPDLLADFVAAFDRLRTRPGFTTQHVRRVFDDTTIKTIQQTIRGLRTDRIKTHETKTLGRLLVHGHPYFTQLQRELTPFVSELAGEKVEPSYNFLSLYTKFGVCPIHMDAPRAKWTLDICIEQTEPWPIHFSQVIPWQENFGHTGENWQEELKRDPQLKFTAHTLHPGEAILFSGSSQWHYRNPLAPASGQGSCKLLFFHYVPEGMAQIADATKWAQIFGVPELREVDQVTG